MRTLEVVAGEREALRSEIAELDAVTEPNEDQVARFAAALNEWDAIEVEHGGIVARNARVDAVRSAAATPANLEPAFHAPDVLVRNNTTDPFDQLDAVRNGVLPVGEMVSRAMDGIEAMADRMEHDSAERATQLVQDNPAVARHVLLTGSQGYHDAFRHLITRQGDINALDPEEQGVIRAALSLTGANGGFMVPMTLDPSIILTNAGSANPFRAISTVKTITTDDWNGVTSAGVNAAWLAEAAVAADATPTVAQPTITPAKAAAWVFGSFEVLSDSTFASEFPGLIVDAKDRLEEAAFATGTGTAQPKGIVTAATTLVNTATVATYAVADVYSLQQAVPARFRLNRKVSFVGNLGIINRTRQFDTAGGASFWANLGSGQPEQLLGGDVYESTTMVNTTTTGSKIMVAGDFSQYFIVDRVGTTVLYEPLVKDAATGRPTGQAGWFAYWRTGADAVVPGAFRTLNVA